MHVWAIMGSKICSLWIMLISDWTPKELFALNYHRMAHFEVWRHQMSGGSVKCMVILPLNNTVWIDSGCSVRISHQIQMSIVYVVFKWQHQRDQMHDVWAIWGLGNKSCSVWIVLMKLKTTYNWMLHHSINVSCWDHQTSGHSGEFSCLVKWQ